MRKLIKILMSLMLYCFLLSPFLLAQEQKTISPSQSKSIESIQKTIDTPVQKETQKFQNKSVSPQKSEIDYEKLFLESQKNFDRSLSILNTATNVMGGIVAWIALIAILVTYYISYSTRKWKKLRKAAQQDAELIKGIRKRLENEASDLLKNINISPTPPLTTSPPEDLEEYKGKLDELGHKLELMEALGSRLKPEEYEAKAKDLFYKGKYHIALEALNKAIELKPDYVFAWHNKSVTLNALGRYEEALKALDKAIALKPDYAEAWNKKSIVLNKLGRNPEALIASEKAIALKPDYAEAWIYRGLILAELGQNQAAITACIKSNELKPNNPMILYNTACAYSKMKNKDGALTFLSKAIISDSKYRNIAKTDEDFKWLWKDTEFLRLITE
ncbi:MAG: tetratricopeptide repeat protein [Desulfobacterales bacterium]|nr:tetratricopeptide repeat protein [Desulfobacterales bacterium]